MPPADPYKYFRVEAAELVELLGQGALAIEKGAPVVGGVAALLRHAHTLKGAARVVKQPAIAECAHMIEEELSAHRSATDGLPRQCAARMFSELDAIAGQLVALGLPPAEPRRAAPPERAGERAIGVPSTLLRAEVGEVEAVVDGVREAQVAFASLKDGLGRVEQVRHLGELIERQLAAPRRADAEKLGALLERVQRVVTDLQAGLSELDLGLRRGLDRVGHELEQTHAAAERLQLVPVSSILISLERGVYDAARELGRNVTFAAQGGEIKLDGQVLAIAHAALLHLVRNAVAHGLEPEQERRARGKPAIGCVQVSVTLQGRYIAFTCRDDGAGVDVTAVRRVLAERGEAHQDLTDDQLLRRLLSGGVSTAERVTGLSGRGVGLDVVRDAAARLGGRVELQAERGRGFSVQLCVPASLTALLVVTVESGGKKLALPLDSVVATERFSSEEISRSGGREVVYHRQQAIPFAPLARVLGMSESSAPVAWSSLIVRGASGSAALGVDRLLGTRTVVLRTLPSAARATAVVAGASLDALGNPELVLDGDALVAQVQRMAGVERRKAPARRPILVIDDSLTTRMLEQSILTSAGYEVTLAVSGEDGLEKARARRYALFLVDVEMPGIDGFTFVEKTRAEAELSGVPAVLVSSRSAPEDIARGHAAGAQAYIVKDRFDQRELLGLIERLVGG